MAWQSGLPLLTCCSARAEAASANHGALFCQLRFLEEHSGLGWGRVGPTESQTLGLDLDHRVQHLQFSCENKQVMRLGQGHGESQIWREGSFCIYSHLYSFTREVFIHCLLWVQGLIGHTGHIAFLILHFFSMLHAFFSKIPRHPRGNFTQTQLEQFLSAPQTPAQL